MGAAWSIVPLLLYDRVRAQDTEICVRGVEIAADTEQNISLKLSEVTRCSLATLLKTSKRRRASYPLDESAISAVLKAETLLVRQDLEYAVELGAAYGRLLRGGAHLILPTTARIPYFERLGSGLGYSWYSRDSIHEDLSLKIVAPVDGTSIYFSEPRDDNTNVLSVTVQLPSKSLLELLPSPRLLVAADSKAEFPLVVPLSHYHQEKNALLELTLSEVPPGSHLLTASLAYGDQGRVVPQASASAMIDLVPEVYSSVDAPSLGCARSSYYQASSHTLNDDNDSKFVFAQSAAASELKSQTRKLRVALVDLLPSLDEEDSSRRKWIQRCTYWKKEFDVSYLLLYDALTPAVPETAPIRQALKETGVRAVAVAAPWHLSSSTSRQSQIEAAQACAANKDSAAATAWLQYLKARVDVLVLHAAPSTEGPRIDAARLACLGALARKAGLNWIIDLPKEPEPQLFAWGQDNRLLLTQNLERREDNEIEIFLSQDHHDQEYTDLSRRGVETRRTADAVVVSSHYAASTLTRFVRGKQYSHGLADASTPVVVLQPGVDDEWFQAAKNTTKREKKTALWLGNLDPSESPLLFVRACALLASAGEEVECLVVGDGPLRAPLLARAEKIMPITNASHAGRYSAMQMHQLLNGSRPAGSTRFLREKRINLPQLVASSHVLVSTSLSATSSFVLEAAAAGVAVVAFAAAGAEHICHGVNALIPEAATPKALASSIRRLIHDQSTADAMGQAGSIAVAAHFAASKAADRAAHLIKSLFTFTHDRPSLAGHDRPRLAPVYDHHSFLADLALLDDHTSRPSSSSFSSPPTTSTTTASSSSPRAFPK